MTGRLKQTHLLGVDAQLALGPVEDPEHGRQQRLDGRRVGTLKLNRVRLKLPETRLKQKRYAWASLGLSLTSRALLWGSPSRPDITCLARAAMAATASSRRVSSLAWSWLPKDLPNWKKKTILYNKKTCCAILWSCFSKCWQVVSCLIVQFCEVVYNLVYLCTML